MVLWGLYYLARMWYLGCDNGQIEVHPKPQTLNLKPMYSQGPNPKSGILEATLISHINPWCYL